jgi:hypothetical protein
VAQGEGHEFKPQYHTHTQKRSFDPLLLSCSCSFTFCHGMMMCYPLPGAGSILLNFLAFRVMSQHISGYKLTSLSYSVTVAGNALRQGLYTLCLVSYWFHHVCFHRSLVAFIEMTMKDAIHPCKWMEETKTVASHLTLICMYNWAHHLGTGASRHSCPPGIS